MQPPLIARNDFRIGYTAPAGVGVADHRCVLLRRRRRGALPRLLLRRLPGRHGRRAALGRRAEDRRAHALPRQAAAGLAGAPAVADVLDLPRADRDRHLRPLRSAVPGAPGGTRQIRDRRRRSGGRRGYRRLRRDGPAGVPRDPRVEQLVRAGPRRLLRRDRRDDVHARPSRRDGQRLLERADRGDRGRGARTERRAGRSVRPVAALAERGRGARGAPADERAARRRLRLRRARPRARRRARPGDRRGDHRHTTVLAFAAVADLAGHFTMFLPCSPPGRTSRRARSCP